MMKHISFFYPKKTGLEKKILEIPLKKGNFNDGKLSNLFALKIKNKVNRKYSVCVTSGTIAIYIALKAIGIKKEDEVIIPCFTYIATANAVRLAGAKLVLADINQYNYTI